MSAREGNLLAPMLTRALLLTPRISKAGNRGDVSESWQSQSMGLSSFLPVHSGGCPRYDSTTTSGPTGEAGLTTAVEPYVWRSCGAVGKAIGWTPAMWGDIAANRTIAAGVRKAVAETQRLRRVVAQVDSEYYPLTAVSTTGAWAAYQHHAPAPSPPPSHSASSPAHPASASSSSGFAVVFRRPGPKPPPPPPVPDVQRLVASSSRWQWMVADGGSGSSGGNGGGYYTGVYNTALAPNVTSLDVCKAQCAADNANCVGLTFVAHGGQPPCVLYSTIGGTTSEWIQHKDVVQWVKLYTCDRGGVAAPCPLYWVDRARSIRHLVQPSPRSVLIDGCNSKFTPRCGGPEACRTLANATDGNAACPPAKFGGHSATAAADADDTASTTTAATTSQTFSLGLRGLDLQRKYAVQVYNESFADVPPVEMTGHDLAQMTLYLKLRSSVLVWYTTL